MKKIVDGLWAKRFLPAFGYAVFLALVLPLYMKNGFVMIGDAKYDCFFQVTILFAGISALLFLIGACFGKVTSFSEPSYTELFVLFFGAATIMSCLLSPYRATALWGYQDWHIGAVTQCMFLFAFFIAKKWGRGDQGVFWISGVTTILVCSLILSNRMGNDPLGTFQGMDWFEWNRRNLLATIGNINWVCCYLSVALPVLLFFAYHAEGRWRIPALVGAFLGIAAICVQGSDVGFADLAIWMILLFWFSLGTTQKLLQFLDVAILFPLFWSIFSIFRIDLILPNEVDLIGRWYTPAWLFPLGLLVAVRLALGFWIKKKKTLFLDHKAFAKWGRMLIAGIAVILLLVFILCQISDQIWLAFGGSPMLRLNDEWGSRRGSVWRTTVSCYGRLDWAGKLIGVGPDCYAHALSSMQMELESEGFWTGATYANAHNELLTMLINEGALGLLAYLGIFASILIKLWKKMEKQEIALLGVLIVSGYLVNHFFTFQQVISTPLVFLFIGMFDRITESVEQVRKKAGASKHKKRK